MNDLQPTLEELCTHRPRLLRAELVPLRARIGARGVREIVLTFDASRLSIELGPAVELRCRIGAEPSDQALENANEDEPWWRVLGAPLVAAWVVLEPKDASAELALQFREDAANPRLISLSRHGDEIRVRCESLPEWKKRLAGVTSPRASLTDSG